MIWYAPNLTPRIYRECVTKGEGCTVLWVRRGQIQCDTRQQGGTLSINTRLWHWPRTLGSRLFVILLVGLIIAHLTLFAVLFSERYLLARQVMLGTLETDVATSVAILNRLPAAERPQWLPRLNRGNYQYILGPGSPGVPKMTQRGKDIAERIMEASGGRFPLAVQSVPGDGKQVQAHLTLSDGSPLTIDQHPRMLPIAQWLPYVLVLQLLLQVLCCWIAVRLAIRPLVALADPADALNPNAKSPPLDESGPTELARAAHAFNAVSDRIAHFVVERVRILAAGGAIVTRPHALRRILTNLIDNAIKFRGAAELSVRRDRDTVRIDVMGSRSRHSGRQAGGCVAAIFQARRLARGRETGGTGLGLAIAHQLAVAVGGSLKLRNRDGGGLIAEIRIG
ncbi:ATP-binding protein [Cupriavidus sp. 8B]